MLQAVSFAGVEPIRLPVAFSLSVLIAVFLRKTIIAVQHGCPFGDPCSVSAFDTITASVLSKKLAVSYRKPPKPLLDLL